MDVIVQVVGIAKLNAEAILIIIGVGRALHKHYNPGYTWRVLFEVRNEDTTQQRIKSSIHWHN